MILMGLTCHEIPWQDVTPKGWQKAVGLIYKKGWKKTQKKNAGKAKAQQLYPNVDVNLAIADALLIAEFGRYQ